ncbi:OmpA family protein [Vaginella massiliensis]|uniref:OmpA family protein n=1 Tax=Vaginella massiliensis TaxID=1816680 RepID=UPI0037531B21
MHQKESVEKVDSQTAIYSPGESLTGSQSSLTGETSDFNIEINLNSDVLFDFDKADLKPEASKELEKAAELIKAKGKGGISITGHTDSKGSESYNQKRSLNRAKAVKDWFEAKGLNYNYTVFGMGAKEPVASNTKPDGSDDPEGRAKNRRVTIVINKQKTLGQ